MTTTHDTGTDMVLCEVDDGVATVTFNNPSKHNALSAEMRHALPGLLQWLQQSPEVRVVVLTGAGDRAFVSGADISEFGDQRTSPEARATYDATFADAGRAWQALEKPIIAMIRGYCIGGGLVTALNADIRIAADDAQFAVPAARLGLGYQYWSIEPLVGLIGWANTSELLFSARRYTAAEAHHMGLVNRVVPVDHLRDEVMDLARAICANAPLTVAACKVGIQQARRDPDRRDLDKVHAMVEACFRSDDYKEGQAAFIEKRTPDFQGR
jgi:enoyl-CoA hydratase